MKRVSKHKPKRKPRCGQCREPMNPVDGFAAWIDGQKVCLHCAFKAIKR